MTENSKNVSPSEVRGWINTPHYTSNVSELTSPHQCHKCLSQTLKIGAGKAPHSASLRCGECGAFIKWVGKKELAELAAIEKSANSPSCEVRYE